MIGPMNSSAWRGWGLAGAVAMVFAAGCAKNGVEKAPASIAWNTAYDAALADAQRTGRPILLDFYTDW